MARNNGLGAAKSAKKDEFYTQLTDIEKEMRHYRSHFKGKTVLCNCDDPFESNFFKYFVLNFNRLGLKKLVATCYFSCPIMGSQLRCRADTNGQMELSFEEDAPADDSAKRPYKAVVTVVYDKTGDGGVDMFDVVELFRSGENQLTGQLHDHGVGRLNGIAHCPFPPRRWPRMRLLFSKSNWTARSFITDQPKRL
ncbi:MAG: hypothetical protein J6C11_10005 [Spirochaetaceae bacterium]|nr:hypothetical protein [Spirochaetaceae bacterium]